MGVNVSYRVISRPFAAFSFFLSFFLSVFPFLLFRYCRGSGAFRMVILGGERGKEGRRREIPRLCALVTLEVRS